MSKKIEKGDKTEEEPPWEGNPTPEIVKMNENIEARQNKTGSEELKTKPDTLLFDNATEETALPLGGRSSGAKVGKIHLESLKTLIEDGRKGKAAWIPISFPMFGHHIQIAQKRYYLLGGASGTGKTALGHQMFILEPYIWYKKNAIDTQETDVKLKIIVRNMERPTSILIGKWCCLYLWTKYKILMDVTSLLGYGQQKSRVTDEIYEKVCEALDYFEEMLDVVEIIPGAENPTGVWRQLQKVAKEDGIEKKVGEWTKIYKPHNDKLITMVVIDHIGRISNERGFDERTNLKKMSEYLSNLRDLYGMTPIVINQFNRGLQETGRRSNLEPEERDFKGASNMYEDCDFAMALFNPYKYKKKEHADYHITKMVSEGGINRFRSLHVLKNSYGMDDFQVGLRFIGETGLFSELVPAKQLGNEQYYRLANLEES